MGFICRLNYTSRINTDVNLLEHVTGPGGTRSCVSICPYPHICVHTDTCQYVCSSNSSLLLLCRVETVFTEAEKLGRERGTRAGGEKESYVPCFPTRVFLCIETVMSSFSNHVKHMSGTVSPAISNIVILYEDSIINIAANRMLA